MSAAPGSLSGCSGDTGTGGKGTPAKNGVMEPARLFESLYTDHAPTGPDYFFPDTDVDVIVDTLHHIRRTAVPEEVA